MAKSDALTDKQLNIIRGKASVGKATAREMISVFKHLDVIEQKLDECDGDDYFGTEGWRKFILGIDE